MTGLNALYGTDEPPAAPPKRAAGELAFEQMATGLRHIMLGGTELIRSVAFLVRDRDWGTLAPEITDPLVSQDGGELSFGATLTYHAGGATLTVELRIRASETGVSFEADGTSSGDFETNRAGFTVLHPVTGQAGAPVTVVHSDGGQEQGAFPELIAPWQPFIDIAAITHRVGGLSCTCRFEGDVFEMEDQRQWGDASFKTYNRPLALPWPYVVPDGSNLRQAVHLRWHRMAAATVEPSSDAPPNARFPQTALIIAPDDARRAAAHPADLGAVGAQRLLCHLDATAGGMRGRFEAFAAVQSARRDLVWDLELIGVFDGDPAEELTAHAQAMRDAGFVPDSVMVCPSVDRQSTPPGSGWPSCPPLETVHEAARAAFGAPAMGGGMASFFPELNRKRPPVEMLDFVTHGLCPIVHDAGDIPVMETLEAVPHITRSARAIIGDRDYRIGPCTIAMRQNPYGTRTVPNPGNARVCMTDTDPRHRAAFGAAYAIGLATALAPAGVTVWTPAALYGPRGVFAPDGRLWPIGEAIAALSAHAGKPVRRARIQDEIAELVLEETAFKANLCAESRQGLPPYGWTSGAIA
jgi:D-apionolactonase